MIMKISHCCVAMLLTLLLASATAGTKLDIAPSHQAAIARMLTASKGDQQVLAGLMNELEQLRVSHAPGQANLREFIDAIQPGQITEHIIPVYAKYFTREDAESLANYFETPGGFKVINAMYNNVKTGSNMWLDSVLLTTPERSALIAFLKTSAGKKFFQPSLPLQEDIKLAFKTWVQGWMEDANKKKMKQAFAPIIKDFDRQIADEAAGIVSSPSTLSPAPSAKNTVYDQIASIFADNTRRTQENGQRFEADLAQIGAGQLMMPDNFISQSGIDEGKLKLQKMADVLDRFLKAGDDIFQETRRQTNEIAMPPKDKEAFLKGIEKSWARIYDENIRYGEIQRNMLEI